jgi:hypothetical protein
VSANGQVGLYGTGLDIRDTTDATTLTAAFQVRGGARFEKKVRISTDLFVGGVLNIGGAQFQDSLGTGVRVDAPGTIRLLGGATAVANQLIPDGAATLGSSSDPWPNSNLSKIFLGSSTEPTINKGTGTPEGVVTAPIGSTYHRKDGGAGTSFYVKESGAGNTGWVGK